MAKKRRRGLEKKPESPAAPEIPEPGWPRGHSRRILFLGAALIVLFTLVIYAQTLAVPPLDFDDSFHLVHSPYVNVAHPFVLLGAVWDEPYFGFFDPVTTTSWMLDRALADKSKPFDAVPFRVSQLFYAIVCAGLVMLVLPRLVLPPPGSSRDAGGIGRRDLCGSSDPYRGGGMALGAQGSDGAAFHAAVFSRLFVGAGRRDAWRVAGAADGDRTALAAGGFGEAGGDRHTADLHRLRILFGAAGWRGEADLDAHVRSGRDLPGGRWNGCHCFSQHAAGRSARRVADRGGRRLHAFVGGGCSARRRPRRFPGRARPRPTGAGSSLRDAGCSLRGWSCLDRLGPIASRRDQGRAVIVADA